MFNATDDKLTHKKLIILFNEYTTACTEMDGMSPQFKETIRSLNFHGQRQAGKSIVLKIRSMFYGKVRMTQEGESRPQKRETRAMPNNS